MASSAAAPPKRRPDAGVRLRELALIDSILAPSATARAIRGWISEMDRRVEADARHFLAMRREPTVRSVAHTGPRGRRVRRASPADAATALERDIHRLAAAIDQFRVDAQRFFAGDLPLPPDELRDRILADLRRLRSSSLQGAAVNFRLGSLEARFNSHLDLFGRRLRAREAAGLKPTAEKAAPDPVKGVVIGRHADPSVTEALFKGLYSGVPGAPKPKMDLGRFRDYIDRQAETIRRKTGCTEIKFRIAVEEGKMKLKAKPLRRPA